MIDLFYQLDGLYFTKLINTINTIGYHNL